MFDRVVVAVDGSSHSRKAIQTAAMLASGGQVVLVHSVNRPAGDSEMAEMAEAEGVAPDVPLGRPHREGAVPPGATGPAYLGSGSDAAGRLETAGQSVGEAILEQARRDAQDQGATKIETVLTRGDPAMEILKVAEDVHADAIVVGSRGRSDIAGLVFGSTSHKLLHLADRTCIVVR